MLSWELPPPDFQHYGYRNNVGTFSSLQKALDYATSSGMDDVIIDLMSIDMSYDVDGSAKFITPRPINCDDFPRRVRNGKLI